jgi:hypothetical protein
MQGFGGGRTDVPVFESLPDFGTFISTGGKEAYLLVPSSL